MGNSENYTERCSSVFFKYGIQKLLMQKLGSIKEQISSGSSKKIIITTHHKPDAEPLGLLCFWRRI